MRCLIYLAAGLLCARSAHAASVFFNFNSDPASLTRNEYGDAYWSSTGGGGAVTNAFDGYLTLTADSNSHRSAVVFDDFDNGQAVTALAFEADFRIGNGTQRPAEGFSISFCRPNDPVLTDVANGGDPSVDPDIWNYGPDCENNLPEEGTRTGLSIGFDAFGSDGTAPYCNGLGQRDSSYFGPDIVGIDVHVDGIQIAQIPMPTLNGSAADPTSLQTGPYSAIHPNDPTILGWAHLKVQLDISHNLSIWWKGVQLLTNHPITYFPTPCRMVLAGRTTNAYEEHDVDNISLTTVPVAFALVGGASGYPDGFRLELTDSGYSVVDPTTVSAELNGTQVAASVSKSGGTTTVTYHGFPTLLPSGSTNSCSVTCQDTNHNIITGTRQFVVPKYVTIPGADAVTGVDTTRPGFRIRPWQSKGEPNHVYWMLEQLAGLHGANAANLTGATGNGYFDWTETKVINFDITPSAADGNFNATNYYPDSPFPGLPGAVGNGTDNSSENMRMFVRFSYPGIYTLGVNSNDGFLVSEGPNPDDWFANWLGFFDDVRGAYDTTFTVAVPAAGVYPVRLAWENGGGSGSCEFFTVTNGVRYLLNDPSPTNTTGITAFYLGPLLPAFLSAVRPNPNSSGAPPNQVFAQLTDEGTTVVGGSIQLYLNDALTAPVVNHSGNNTTVTLNLDVNHLLAPVSSNNAALVWSDSADNNHSNHWRFVVGPYVTLDPSQASPLGSQDTTRPGFVLHVTQVDECLPNFIDPNVASDCGDGTEDDTDSANAMVGGGYFPFYGTNTVDASTAVASNMWSITGVPDFNIVSTPGDFTVDNAMPGIPSRDGVPGNNPNNSFSVWLDTYVVFAIAGLYTMGVASDDGFRLSEGIGVSRQVLHVKGDHVDRDLACVPCTASNVGGIFKANLPVEPIEAEVAYVDSSQCPGPTTMDLTGKIALIDSDRCTPGANGNASDQIAMCQARGAIAVLYQYYPAWGTELRIGGGGVTAINIPVLSLSGYNGFKELFHTNGTVTTSIGADTHLMIGQANYGKGFDHQDRMFIVPQAGVYPMHLTYEQGGGTAGLEWTSIAADGTRILINDTSNPNAILAFQARTRTEPSISVARSGDNSVITYVGTLVSSLIITGPYTPVPGAASPYTIPAGSAPTRFYRTASQQ